jgi:hypothetical protein
MYEELAKTPEELTDKQLEKVDAADSRLTEKERLTLDRREENVDRQNLTHSGADSESRGEGTSKGKGEDGGCYQTKTLWLAVHPGQDLGE